MKSTSAKKTLTIEEVAHELTISVATVSNWIKLGKINKVKKLGRILYFDKDEITRIKQDISMGNSNKLQSRRNKKMVLGKFIPTEYVSYDPYMPIMDQIITLAKRLKDEASVSVIVLEIALKFLHSRKKIYGQVSGDESLIELYLNNSLVIPIYLQPIIKSLLNKKEMVKTAEAFSVLRDINQLNIPYIPGEDFLGLAYMSLSASNSRKNSGSYYTPSKVVDLIMSQNAHIVKNKPDAKVIDPCCGSGNFLIKAFLLLRQELLERGKTIEEAERQIIENGLYGYDVNETAVTLSALNLILLMDSEQQTRRPNIICENTLLDTTPLSLYANDESYDWVIGNPPWGYSFNEQEKQELKQMYTISGKSIESFALFIECGTHLLKEGGSLTYVLPESFLNIKVHSNIRENILRYTTIDSVCLLDRAFSNVFTKTITLTFTKKKIRKGHMIKVIDSERVVEIDQNRFLKNEYYIFNVNSDDRIFTILDRIKNHKDAFYLTDKVHAEFALGIVTGDNNKHISNETGPNKEGIVTGKNVFKYNFYQDDKYIDFNPASFQQVAPERLYRAQEKLFYRFINKDLVFSYDNNQTLSLNSANILIPKHEKYQAKYILAILNSRVAQFFHTYSFSALKVLKKHIESIPIPFCSNTEQELLIRLVDSILSTEDSMNRKAIYEQIDRLVMDIYGLDNETRDYLVYNLVDIKFLSK